MKQILSSKCGWISLTLVMILLTGFQSMPANAIENNINITGNLVLEPCVLSPESTMIPLDFGSVVARTFMTETRTAGMPFSIKLIDCDTSIGKSATLTFIGHESEALPGLLAPDGDTTGLAFGLETVPDPEHGVSVEPVLINQPSPLFTLSDNNTQINLQGYIAAEPKAVENQLIKAGPFMATATFKIDYP